MEGYLRVAFCFLTNGVDNEMPKAFAHLIQVGL